MIKQFHIVDYLAEWNFFLRFPSDSYDNGSFKVSSVSVCISDLILIGYEKSGFRFKM